MSACVISLEKPIITGTLGRKGQKGGIRSWQDSNLRGETPMDFESIALTTRPQLLKDSSRAAFQCELTRCNDQTCGSLTTGLYCFHSRSFSS